MTLTEEYEQQNQWRNWESYLTKLPIKNTDVVLDLGCGVGDVTKLLGERCLQVFGIDHNPELLQSAKRNNNLGNIEFISSDLSQILINIEIPNVDGIWCSFTAAYFPNFKPVLSNWIKKLKSGGWIALVEIDDLFGHHPLPTETKAFFKSHYKKLYDQLTYDFEMGSKLRNYLVDCGLTVIFEQNVKDPELAFNGLADNRVVLAWQNRLDRMTGLQNSLESFQFIRLKMDFLNCLRDENHTCSALVKYFIAKKDNL
ncbi:class I SAM-dependent methyltransferase [Mucilaginibacter polytrichastri]|uniref:Methyltransferase type 11 domain-containing protein n=1 Tax=Mucilaginibacter polytrichastri TaxID=1302689 RepID=A0A1Q5ZYA2_9SPHI|nr:class I SAM-dependent methyltransferase [Mucilaginibacter polytrichastri]OKS86727.1 hypothetical protein RG47T_2184 [Mucilaginibacter polytrichastri]SFS82788.1 Methyltransferase domain-containing protein [Mucilaginibacter polytrichastri]